MARLEPTMEVSVAPVKAWAMAVWHGSAEADTMQKAWRQKVHLGVQRKWKEVHGPAAATALSLVRAQWAWPAWHHFLTREKAVTARWLDPSHGGINLGFPQNT